MVEVERSLAVFVDFENLALGFQGRRERFDIARVLERLVEKGKIVAKKAYADWNRFAMFTAALHEAAIELIEIPRRAQSGKNSADIRLCVDAMDLAYSKEHINTFVILSGDSDFSPLVSKLKELGKHVIGLGMQESTSPLLRDNCDEFIYYEDLGQGANLAPSIDSHVPETKRKAFALLLESLLALRRENKEVLWSSMVKDTMKRKKPSFNETYHGYRTFSELLEDAQREGLLELETDKRSRTYVVTRFGSEITHEEGSPAAAALLPGIGMGSTPPPAPRIGPSAAAPPPRPAPAVAYPMNSPVPSGEGQMPMKKKSRRRRRGRGQKDVVNGSNGSTPGAPPTQGQPFLREPRVDVAVPPESRPPAAEPAASEPAPEPVRAETEAPLPPPGPEPEPVPKVKAPPEPEPAPAEAVEKTKPAASEAEPPAPRGRTRKSATPRTTTRTRKSSGEGSRSRTKSPDKSESKPASEGAAEE